MKHSGTIVLPKVTPLVLKRRAEAFDHADWLFAGPASHFGRRPFVIEPQQVECDKAHRVSAAEHFNKDWAASLVGADDLTIEDGVVNA